MMLRIVCAGLLLLGCAMAQVPVVEAEEATTESKEGDADGLKLTAPKLSAEARTAIQEARKLEKEARKVTGPARSRKLEVAAAQFDRLVAKFEAEPEAAALAAWTAAGIWRRHGSAPLAEKDYLYAAKTNAARYGQRALLGAADMQRRQERVEDAMKTYALAEAVDPRSSNAQEARLWVARMLQGSNQIDAAIEKFQAALESAPSARQGIDAADYLAKAWIVKGDLDAAGFVIDHAEKLVASEQDGDAVLAERLRRAFERMSARKALQRALDEKTGVKQDAVRLDADLRRGAGEAAEPEVPATPAKPAKSANRAKPAKSGK